MTVPMSSFHAWMAGTASASRRPELPNPRGSKVMRREKDASREMKRLTEGSSQIISTEALPVIGSTTSMGPSPQTWNAR